MHSLRHKGNNSATTLASTRAVFNDLDSALNCCAINGVVTGYRASSTSGDPSEIKSTSLLARSILCICPVITLDEDREDGGEEEEESGDPRGRGMSDGMSLSSWLVLLECRDADSLSEVMERLVAVTAEDETGKGIERRGSEDGRARRWGDTIRAGPSSIGKSIYHLTYGVIELLRKWLVNHRRDLARRRSVEGLQFLRCPATVVIVPFALTSNLLIAVIVKSTWCVTCFQSNYRGVSAIPIFRDGSGPSTRRGLRAVPTRTLRGHSD